MNGIMIPVAAMGPLASYIREASLQDRWAVSGEETLLRVQKKITDTVTDLFQEYIQYCEEPMEGVPERFQEYGPIELLRLFEDIVIQMEEYISHVQKEKFQIWNVLDIIPIVCMNKVIIIF